MDPNANLARQEAILLDPTPAGSVERRPLLAELRELREALQGWIARGGFEPDWSKAPHARKLYNA